MGVYINGMEMPNSCYFCPLTNDGFYLCKANNPHKCLENDCEERRPDWCPLVSVPPHGRLIDGDALLAAFEEDISAKSKHMELLRSVHDMQSYFNIDKVMIGMVSCRRVLNNAPTIIEADGGDGNENV